MGGSTRRSFLSSSARAAAAFGVSRAAGAFAQAQTSAAGVVVDSRRVVATLDRRLFGSFLEHLGRAIYGGIFEPGSPLADQNGFRRDVLGEISTLGVPIVRYPGGNFVSGYDWLDGVGPSAPVPRFSIEPGIPSRPINSAPNEFWRGAAPPAPNPCSG